MEKQTDIELEIARKELENCRAEILAYRRELEESVRSYNTVAIEKENLDTDLTAEIVSLTEDRDDAWKRADALEMDPQMYSYIMAVMLRYKGEIEDQISKKAERITTYLVTDPAMTNYEAVRTLAREHIDLRDDLTELEQVIDRFTEKYGREG